MVLKIQFSSILGVKKNLSDYCEIIFQQSYIQTYLQTAYSSSFIPRNATYYLGDPLSYIWKVAPHSKISHLAPCQAY